MLQYCDIYPIQLPARYANKFACYETVYIISNWSLEDQYKEVQKDNPGIMESISKEDSRSDYLQGRRHTDTL